MAGGGERADHKDVRAVVNDVHGGVGVAGEFAEEYGKGTEESGKTEAATKVQLVL
jgi:hypothetical protein